MVAAVDSKTHGSELRQILSRPNKEPAAKLSNAIDKASKDFRNKPKVQDEFSKIIEKEIKPSIESTSEVRQDLKTNEIYSTNSNKAKVVRHHAPEKDDILFSQHAIKRAQERSIHLDAEEFTKLKTAQQKLESKGGIESLVVTDRAAYILDVSNKKVITAMTKEDLKQNMFTNIDSTIFV